SCQRASWSGGLGEAELLAAGASHPHGLQPVNYADTRPLTPVLVGATAVGKTAVAAAWAEREPVTVISADARQVYRRLDIGTAKPASALLARVPHLGLDLIEPGERYSAGR